MSSYISVLVKGFFDSAEQELFNIRTHFFLPDLKQTFCSQEIHLQKLDFAQHKKRNNPKHIQLFRVNDVIVAVQVQICYSNDYSNVVFQVLINKRYYPILSLKTLKMYVKVIFSGAVDLNYISRKPYIFILSLGEKLYFFALRT